MRARLRGAAIADSSGGVAREDAGARNSRLDRVLRFALRKRSRFASRTVSTTPRTTRIAAGIGDAADPCDTGYARPRYRGGLVSTLRRRGPRRRDGEADRGPLR